VSIRFTADEILAVAEQIERNGARYYESAAKLSCDPRFREFLLDLAGRERIHEKTFAAIRGKLTTREKESTTLDPLAESALYLKALADASVFHPDDNPATRLGANASHRDILKVAIGLEKDSIVFYVGMREVTPTAQGKARVDEILREEMRHVTTLMAEMSQLRD
jgi:rubrerythrin